MSLMNTFEAAEKLHIAPTTLRKWVSQRKIEHTKIGRKVFFNSEIIDDFIDAGTVPVEDAS